MDKQIKIVTGKVHSGKTTGLFKFINSQKSVDGILVPIINERRMLYHIFSKQLKIFEVENKSDETVTIGKYNFLIKSFNWANEKLHYGFLRNPEWLVIDEIGKLELDGKGFFESTNFILKNLANSNTKIILVIRDYLVKPALEYFNIDENDIEYLQV